MGNIFAPIFCLCIISSSLGLNQYLLLDYFTRRVTIDHFVMFSCQYNYEWSSKIYDVAKRLHNHDISTMIVPKSSHQSVVDILSHRIVAKTGVAVECDCFEGQQRLLQASSYRYFNSSFEFLFISEQEDVVPILRPLYNISVNSHITLAQRFLNSEKYVLYEVFSRGQQLGESIIAAEYGRFDENGFQEISYNWRNRFNFTGMTLRGVTVIDIADISSDDIPRMLSSPEILQGLSNTAKYHFVLNQFLQHMFGFEIRYRNTREWTGRLRNNYQTGIMGVGARREADIFSGAIPKASRHDLFDNIHSSYKFVVGFVYIMTPELAKISSNISKFFIPFSKSIWIVLAICGFSLTIIFIILENSHDRVSHSLLHTMGIFTQQGLDTLSSRFETRVLLFSFSLTSFILYNFYTSIVVGSLLLTRQRGPTTLRELIDSPLVLSFDDVAYHRSFFRSHEMPPIVQELYEKKVQPPRRDVDPKPFTTKEIAMSCVKRGGYAFQSELNLLYPTVARVLDNVELCRFRIVKGTWPVLRIMMFLPKRSQYSEMFKIGLMWACEVGLCKRELNKYDFYIPKCPPGYNFDPVTLHDVKLAYIVLISGIILSFMIFLAELIVYRIQTKSQNYRKFFKGNRKAKGKENTKEQSQIEFTN